MESGGSGLLQTIAAWGAAGAGGIGTLALLRRRLSRDRTEVTKDAAEAEFVQLLLDERNRAITDGRAARAAHEENVRLIARLTAQNEYLSREVVRQREELGAFRRMVLRLAPETLRFLQSDRQPLADDNGP